VIASCVQVCLDSRASKAGLEILDLKDLLAAQDSWDSWGRLEPPAIQEILAGRVLLGLLDNLDLKGSPVSR